MKYLIFIAAFCTGQLSLHAQQTEALSPIIFIYDASGSMWGKLDGKTKKEIASEVLSNSVNGLAENQKVGLVAYGHRQKGDCRDVEILVASDNHSKSKITDAIKGIKPLGKTPLAHSAKMVIDDLRSAKKKATIILVTDGIESCDGNICDVVSAAKKEGIDFKLHIVGFGLKSGEAEQLKCAAQAGGGKYYDAADAGGLGDVLNEATAQTVDKPAFNFGVYAVKNGVSIDSWVRAYDTKSKREPIVVRTYKDTGFMYLPPSTYDLEIKPLEGSQVNAIRVKNVSSFEDKIIYKTVSFDAAKFNFITTNNGEYWDCSVNIFDQDGKAAGQTRTYKSPKTVELNPGIYDIKIQALAMKGMHTNIVIEDAELSSGVVDIKHEFKTGQLFINPMLNGKTIDTITKCIETSSGKNVAAGRTYTSGKTFTLNPGTYRVELTALGANKDKGEKTITVEIGEGDKVSKVVNF